MPLPDQAAIPQTLAEKIPVADKTKRQHFVPQFLLRNFTNESGKLWVYDKSEDRAFPSGTQNIACDGYFYDDETVAQVTGEDQFVEKALAAAEGKWSANLSTVLERVRATKNMQFAVLSDEERSSMSEMMAVQMIRTPLVRETNSQMKDAMVRVLKRFSGEDEIPDDKLPEEFRDFDAKQFHVVSMLGHESVTTYQKIFFGHIWVFLRAAGLGSFYSSDHPVARRPHVTGGWMSHSGIGSRGIEIAFPIAHDVCLQMYDREHFSQMQIMEETVNDAPKDQMLLYYNAMQVESSHRFLYSKDNDFSHAELVCKDVPEFRNPDRKKVVVSGDEDYPNG